MISQFIVNGIFTGCIFSLVALGFGLIYNSTKVFHVAHGVVYTASAYVFYSLLILFHLNLVLSLFITLNFSILLGLFLERFIYYPLYRKGASTGVIFISSLGIYTLGTNFIAMLFGNKTQILSTNVEKVFHLGTAILTRLQMIVVVAFLVICSTTLFFFKFSKKGQLIQALADNPQLVSVIGIDIKKLRLLIFGLGSLLAGFAACFVALDVGMDPQVGMDIILTAIIAVIIGGAKIFHGAIIGAFLIAFLQNLAIWQVSSKWSQAVIFLLLIVVLSIRPEGILGGKKRIGES
jgi:branched-chain amino acid transport system permease protein